MRMIPMEARKLQFLYKVSSRSQCLKFAYLIGDHVHLKYSFMLCHKLKKLKTFVFSECVTI